MLIGTTPLEQLVSELPTIPNWDIEPVVLDGVEILQAQFELAATNIEQLLPPALHPTIPPLGHWSCWEVPDSPWGSFKLVKFRLSCRSGARPRTFLLGAFIDNQEAQQNLSNNWGLAARQAKISFVRSYDAAEFNVIVNKQLALDVKLRNPESLATADLQLFASMQGANTPSGVRLVQFDPSYEVNRTERYTPTIDHFAPHVWQREGIDPVYAVTAWGANTTIHLPKIRFVCRPDIDAFRGTESVAKP
ncbi:MAG: hypothetical protein OXG25_15480 [Gammaproteobacteria bacterium]|nr:hypothetical protein [Gammaproteobacteria bacterium]